VTALRDADALVEVVRGFPDLAGAVPQPADDIDAFDTELALADLGQIEKRLERAKKEKGREREIALLGRLKAQVDEGRPLRLMSLTADERSELAGFAFLSLRPLLVVLNVPEDQVAHPVPEAVMARAKAAGADVIALSAKVEGEVAELEPDDRAAFLADLGLTETARDRFVRASMRCSIW
jgi:ribosome-binding ATPase